MNIYVFGLGALGSNILFNLVKKYPEITYYGIDYDKVEERNTATQVYFTSHKGLPKAQAILPVLGTKLSKFKYKPISKKMETSADIKKVIESNSNNDESIILDCFDNAESRKLFESLNGDILHVGFSPHYAAEILWNENYSTPNDIPADVNDICTMSEAIPFIQYVTSIATFVLSDFIDTEKKDNYIVTNKINLTQL